MRTPRISSVISSKDFWRDFKKDCWLCNLDWPMTRFEFWYQVVAIMALVFALVYVNL